MSIDEKYKIDRQGKTFVLYAGLLNEAHKVGLKSVVTQLLQAPNAEAGIDTAIVQARVEMEDGRGFCGIGDASPKNVGRNIVPHIIRMAETRAKARALRDAVNIDAAVEGDPADEDVPDLTPVNLSAMKGGAATSGLAERTQAKSQLASEEMLRELEFLAGELGKSDGEIAKGRAYYSTRPRAEVEAKLEQMREEGVEAK